MDIEHLKYPIGKFVRPEVISDQHLQQAIEYLNEYPDLLNRTHQSFDSQYFNKKYRPGGWTVAQVIHHLADSHMNALIRFKMALTENNPIIKPYDEAQWAKLADYSLGTSISVKMIEGIHKKWGEILKNMSFPDFEKCYFHPDLKQMVSLKEVCLLYEWHGKHHLAHLRLPQLYK
ncbi:YfiT family bacillithiol transferase [Algoriphagus sediminis]|uniref:Metal-dependent hydrolase n=1 Tax=Algoriphagus sediminis TaxID=3057113 RepID=A0ABT7YBS1_9BACT|nr:putative metal-dependent hydrolase [Algoriphagus sediminis]MDN3203963.1 putative metal-dependent hydrolase [Algoriphagus sediminis]